MWWCRRLHPEPKELLNRQGAKNAMAGMGGRPTVWERGKFRMGCARPGGPTMVRGSEPWSGDAANCASGKESEKSVRANRKSLNLVDIRPSECYMEDSRGGGIPGIRATGGITWRNHTHSRDDSEN